MINVLKMSEKTVESRLVPLNLIYDYPVDWSQFKVLRDLIQNFYDALGHKRWHKHFIYEITGDTLRFEAENISFSYDWLLHIGASTKREKNGEYAGYFGEGFKIASLCALRDYGWNIEMYSRDWKLKVMTDEIVVDDRILKSLAYRIWKRARVTRNTGLILRPFYDEYNELLKSALLSFYYRENALLGKEIWSSDKVAIFKRSSVPKPDYYPCTYEYDGEGVLFAGYQAMGSFPYPLVICLHDYRIKDRERNSFYKMDVVDILKEVAWKMSLSAASEILQVFKNRWYEYPRKRYDFDSWYSIVNILSEKIGKSPAEVKKWKKKYPHLLVARKIKKNNIPAYNRRREALSWLRNQDIKYRLVQDGFLEMGYPTLEELCEKNGGFSNAEEPQGHEISLIRHLQNAASILLEGYLDDNMLPPCKVIRGKNTTWQGMANLIPLKRPKETVTGRKIRYKLPYIAIQSDLLVAGRFGEALSTYLHEVAHCFGGDQSANFGHAVSEILTITLNNTLCIEAFRKAWEKEFS